MADHGLTPRQLEQFREVLRPFIDSISMVGLFGSRATGTYRDNSDIDLVVYGTVTQADIDRLWSAFDASLLAVKVDVVGYDFVTYPALRSHIDAVMQPLFSQADLNPINQDKSDADY